MVGGEGKPGDRLGGEISLRGKLNESLIRGGERVWRRAAAINEEEKAAAAAAVAAAATGVMWERGWGKRGRTSVH